MIFDKIHILFILSNIYESTNGVSKKYIKFIQFLSQHPPPSPNPPLFPFLPPLPIPLPMPFGPPFPPALIGLPITSPYALPPPSQPGGLSFSPALLCFRGPAPFRLNTTTARDLLAVKKVRLAKEEEFSDLFPDCATGAMPPFGNLYDVPVYVDQSLAEESNIVFRIGTHRETMKVAYADFSRLAQPTVGEFAREI